MEDLKKPYPRPATTPAPSRTRRSLSTARRNRSYVSMAFLALLALFVLVHVRPFQCLRHRTLMPSSPPPPPVGQQPQPSEGRLVALEAHIMSKCPDAKDCLREMIVPVMERAHSRINFTLSFVGSPAGDSGVLCRHGPAECMGNILELCAAHLYPDPKTSLGFTMCITNNYEEIPKRDLVEPCALEHAVDLKALNDCAARDNGAFGEDMLRRSVQRTIDAGVTLSCTVRVNEKVWCIRDGGEWVDCPNGHSVETLVTEIERLSRTLAPAA